MIRETVARFIRRVSDKVLLGRNATRIVLGTDRKDTTTSGYGDGSDKARTGAGAIDIVAGYQGSDPNFEEDKSRIYVSALCDPDDYASINVGPAQTGTAANVIISDQVYIKARQFIKIVNENVSIVISPDGNIDIEATGDTRIKSGESVISMGAGGDINIGSEEGPARRILTEEDTCVGIDPTTGAPIQSRFTTGIGINHPLGGVVQNQKVKVVG